ncbi:MAG: DinB family protein [Fimbriimonas sp.]
MASHIRDSLLMLLDEAYVSEGHESTWFKDNEPSSSIIPSLDVLTAEQAGRTPPIGRNPVAGHAAHLATALEAFTRAARGGPWEIDWEASWNFAQPLDDAAWQALRDRLQTAYTESRAALAEGEFKEEYFLPLAASLAHAAYHLGAIRQLAADVLPHAKV